MDLGLKDQVAFVAGSSRGIGKAIATELLREGARVVLTGRDKTSLDVARLELAAVAGEEGILAIAGDFGDEATIRGAFERTVARFGRFDHLVANLGTGSGKPGWDQPATEWARLFELNFFASTRLAQAAVPIFLSNANGGSIVFISSITAIETTPAPLPYSAAKAALINYAKNLARQVAPKVRVNSIAPGNILFPGGSWERHLNTSHEAVETMLRSEVPLQRFGTPEEIASLAAYLCSQRAAFATGGCYVMDGGQTRSL